MEPRFEIVRFRYKGRLSLKQLNRLRKKMNDPAGIAFQVIDWTSIAPTRHPGETGDAFWQTLQLPGLRIRTVYYSPGYLADHWCQKGHIVHVLEGSFYSELEGGETVSLHAGMTYVVSDGWSKHRSRTETGVKLLIVDGDFLRAGPKPIGE